MGLENPLHIAVILLVVLLVFGAKRLPEMGRSLGEGLRGFKETISGDSPSPRLSAVHTEVEHPVDAIPPGRALRYSRWRRLAPGSAGPNEDRDRRRRGLRARCGTSAPVGARGHRVRGRRLRRRAHQHDPGRHAERDPSRRHRLHRLQRPQLPELRAAAGAPRRRLPALGDELQRQRRARRLRVQRGLAERPVRQARPPRHAVVSPHGDGPGPLQPGRPRPFSAATATAPRSALARGAALLPAVHRPADRARRPPPCGLPTRTRCGASRPGSCSSSSTTTACSRCAGGRTGEPSAAARPGTSRR